MEAQVPDEREFPSVAGPGMEMESHAEASAWRSGRHGDQQQQWEGRRQGQTTAPLRGLNGDWRAEGMSG